MIQGPRGKQYLTEVGFLMKALLAEGWVGLREPTRGGEAPRD